MCVCVCVGPSSPLSILPFENFSSQRALSEDDDGISPAAQSCGSFCRSDNLSSLSPSVRDMGMVRVRPADAVWPRLREATGTDVAEWPGCVDKTFAIRVGSALRTCRVTLGDLFLVRLYKSGQYRYTTLQYSCAAAYPGPSRVVDTGGHLLLKNQQRKKGKKKKSCLPR